MDNSVESMFNLADDTLDYQVTREMVAHLIQQHQEDYQSLARFDFNIFKFNAKIGRKNVLPFVAASLLKANKLEGLVDYDKYLKFMSEIYNQYKRSVIYHNDIHGSDVAQHVNFILKS